MLIAQVVVNPTTIRSRSRRHPTCDDSRLFFDIPLVYMLVIQYMSNTILYIVVARWCSPGTPPMKLTAMIYLKYWNQTKPDNCISRYSFDWWVGVYFKVCYLLYSIIFDSFWRCCITVSHFCLTHAISTKPTPTHHFFLTHAISTKPTNKANNKP
jgi:hypothetical protein